MTRRLPRDGSSVLVVAHDAGGAEVVSSWLRRQSAYRIQCVVDGPATAIFERKLPTVPRGSTADLQDLIRASDFVLTGTGWASGLEWSAICAARDAGVPVASYLDHWVNYRERFHSGDRLCLPDELWVGDEYAQALASRTFPGTPIRYEPNAYFRDQVEELQRMSAAGHAGNALRVLYLCEPIIDQVRKGFSADVGYDEFEAIQYALERVLDTRAAAGLKVRVRLHPAEPAGKYDAVLSRFDREALETSSGSTLVEDCAWADWVIGCESMAMVIALLAGRRVLCAIPPHGAPCRLPHAGIEPLANANLIWPAPA